MRRADEDRGEGGITRDEGYLVASDGARLFFRSASPAEPAAVKGHLALVHGYCDHSGRYRELTERAVGQGLAVHAIDLRGHGRSDGRRAHCEAFSDYLADLDALMAHARSRAAGGRLFWLGHSFGGLASMHWAAVRRPVLGGLILSAPFMGLAFEPPWLKLQVARVADRLLPWLPVGNELDPAQLTHDLEVQRATASDPLYLRVATPRWFTETRRAFGQVLGEAPAVSVPALVLIGSSDPIAAPEAGRRLFERLGAPDKTLKTYAGMLHEVLNEIGREKVHADLLGWIQARR